jgi:hypothetical protein
MTWQVLVNTSDVALVEAEQQKNLERFEAIIKGRSTFLTHQVIKTHYRDMQPFSRMSFHIHFSNFSRPLQS